MSLTSTTPFILLSLLFTLTTLPHLTISSSSTVAATVACDSTPYPSFCAKSILSSQTPQPLATFALLSLSKSLTTSLSLTSPPSPPSSAKPAPPSPPPLSLPLKTAPNLPTSPSTRFPPPMTLLPPPPPPLSPRRNTGWYESGIYIIPLFFMDNLSYL